MTSDRLGGLLTSERSCKHGDFLQPEVMGCAGEEGSSSAGAGSLDTCVLGCVCDDTAHRPIVLPLPAGDRAVHSSLCLDG